jgi:hypothetical protein
MRDREDLWAGLIRLGVKDGLDWRNCPRCHATLAREVRTDTCARGARRWRA